MNPFFATEPRILSFQNLLTHSKFLLNHHFYIIPPAFAAEPILPPCFIETKKESQFLWNSFAVRTGLVIDAVALLAKNPDPGSRGGYIQKKKKPFGFFLRCVRDSNPWPPAWQADILTNWTNAPLCFSALFVSQSECKGKDFFWICKCFANFFSFLVHFFWFSLKNRVFTLFFALKWHRRTLLFLLSNL